MSNRIWSRVSYNPVNCCMSSLSEFDDAVKDALDPEK